MLSVRVDGTWLRAIGAWSDLTMSHAWPHGSEQLTWTMTTGLRHPALTTDALTECFDGGQRVWLGRLGQPGVSGEMAATGLWDEASGVLAVDGSGVASNIPDVATDAAGARGAVSWSRLTSLMSTSWGTAGEPMTLVDLLDKAMAGLGKRWYVDANGTVGSAADPTTPKYHVPQAAAAYGLTLVDDDYYSHLTGTYLSAVGVYSTVTVGSAVPFGRREAWVDLTPMGVISSGTATAEVTNRLAASGTRLGFGESLNLGRGQITTPGGTSVALTMPRAGEMARLMGVTSTTGLPYTDIVIGRSVYKDGDATVQLSPFGLAVRNLSDALTVAVA